MTRNTRLKSVCAVLMLAAAAATQAQTAVPSVPAASATAGGKLDNRQARQQDRIAAGAAGGQLTAKEALRLEKEQARVDKKQEKVMADGQVTNEERKKMRKAQRDANHDISRKLENKAGDAPKP